MSLLLKNCHIFDPSSRHHRSVTNILIEKGVVQSVGEVSEASTERDLGGLMVTPGWVDMNCQFGDPGYEHKETLLSGSSAAAQGGYTDLVLQPNSSPVVDTKSAVEYINSFSGTRVDLHPSAALSEGCRGENMTEILDLNEAGAVAFSDGNVPVWNLELFQRVLLYTKQFDGLVMSRPEDRFLARNSQMHEGKVSTTLGMTGEPSISEKIQVSNQLEMLRYTGGRLHFSMLSTLEAVKLIRAAKREGLNVTCDVGVHHLSFTDESIKEFNTNYKVSPPFRTTTDRQALIKGVNDGTIDAIVSGHQPQDHESKSLEFNLAEPGIIGLQTTYSILQRIQGLDFDKAITALTVNPRSILGLDSVGIREGSLAKLAVFDPAVEWSFDSKTNQSKSDNSPFFDKRLVGRCMGTINRSKVSLTV